VSCFGLAGWYGRNGIPPLRPARETENDEDGGGIVPSSS
jgi:hypothetical protein